MHLAILAVHLIATIGRLLPRRRSICPLRRAAAETPAIDHESVAVRGPKLRPIDHIIASLCA
ncbi:MULTISPECIES: hypothetical protein [Steroidobacteraceae]|uniref:hypothetical protein n=1 Tax=Steroidobacteraceae TaxID=2689614 RepID=UPI00101B7755|nr:MULTISPECIES: hypothetical protein [Steroidobacteraceae]